MRLELGSFPVTDIVFGARTRWQDSVLEIDARALLEEMRSDPRITRAELELARPGESVRIWPVRDAVEPRIKVEGPGVAYPGICGRAIDTVGQGRTHRLAGMSVVEVSEVLPHDAGGDYNSIFYDMSGPWAEMIPMSKLLNLCLLVEADPALTIIDQNDAVHRATLKLADRLAATTVGLEPPQREVFELGPVDPALPKVVYIPCLHSAQAMSGNGSNGFFCTTATYGLSMLTPPWPMHPNEILDGAITGPYRIATSWHLANNRILLELYRRHGVDLNFAGVIAVRTEWTTMEEKELMCLQTAKVAQMLGAQGAIVAWDAGGNEFLEVVHTVRACQRAGIKTVLLTSEDDPTGGAPTLLEPLPEADAVVSTFIGGSGYPGGSGPASSQMLPAMARVIGSPTRLVGAVRDEVIDVAGPMPPPRYNDTYGFGRYSGVEY
ncbi:MAG: hypothetical protein HYY02_00325 [Chloroflexi bacterium]|nr:hypothetical protein [Chloroflexota bacterium]